MCVCGRDLSVVVKMSKPRGRAGVEVSFYKAICEKILLPALSFTAVGTYHGYQYYIGDTEVDYSTIFYDCGSYEMAVIRDLQTQLALLTDITNAGER